MRCMLGNNFDYHNNRTARAKFDKETSSIFLFVTASQEPFVTFQQHLWITCILLAMSAISQYNKSFLKILFGHVSSLLYAKE